MHNFLSGIYRWYYNNNRELPWRETRDPYKIWISEIILQQTRVAQGIKYYLNFTGRFPTVKHLAAASEDEVLKLWQGLGYYSRARNLHAAARQIVEEYDGIFPGDYDDIIGLKGVGPYTAAAVASIAFGLPCPAVDGNVYRVLSRYFGIETPIDSGKGKKEFAALAAELIKGNDPGMHNQALMEFGALQCVPRSPDCSNCPVMDTCHSFKHGTVEKLPVKTQKARQTKRYFYYYLLHSGNSVFLEKRVANDIWKNLYQFPLVETGKELTDKQLMNTELPFIEQGKVNVKSVSAPKKHVLSHQVIFARLVELEYGNDVRISGNLIEVNQKDIYKFAVPKLIDQFFEELKL